MEEELKNENINLELEPDDDNIEINADFNQLSQVLINLIKNSKESLATVKTGNIKIYGFRDEEGNINIEVRDNGKGIPVAILDDIFMPFFTTKKEGSGIGLSMARQIMRSHNGTIGVQSQPGKTVFKLKL